MFKSNTHVIQFLVHSLIFCPCSEFETCRGNSSCSEPWYRSAERRRDCLHWCNHTLWPITTRKSHQCFSFQMQFNTIQPTLAQQTAVMVVDKHIWDSLSLSLSVCWYLCLPSHSPPPLPPTHTHIHTCLWKRKKSWHDISVFANHFLVVVQWLQIVF